MEKVTDFRTPDQKVNAYITGDDIHIWWSHTDDNNYGDVLLLRPSDYESLMYKLQNYLTGSVVFEQTWETTTFQLMIFGDKLRLWVRSDGEYRAGELPTSALLDLLKCSMQ